MFQRIRRMGPGAMIAAAFIGPGTVTTATLAGAGYGLTLLWAVVFSIFSTCILQEMSVRLGVVGDMGLGEAIRHKFNLPVSRWISGLLIIGAIFIGNAAYEAGNITGAGLGFLTYIDPNQFLINPLYLAIGVAAFLLLNSGRYKLIEKSLVMMVGVMGLVFIAAAIGTKPDIVSIIKGVFIPTLPDDAILMVVGLIGTTVVPYNLFLHASSVKYRFKGPDALIDARWDSVLAILLGGLITLSIVIAAAASVEGGTASIESVSDMSHSLQPLMGTWSTPFIAMGFLAAGFSSSVTAPLAAAFAICGVMGWSADLRSRHFRMIWMPVLLIGIFFASLNFKPVEVILFAQVTNGILLPVIAGFLLWTMNDQKIMGRFANSARINILGILVLGITFLLGLKSIFSAFNWL